MACRLHLAFCVPGSCSASATFGPSSAAASLTRQAHLCPCSRAPSTALSPPSLPPLQDKGADTSSAVEREDLLEMARKMESGAGDK